MSTSLRLVAAFVCVSGLTACQKKPADTAVTPAPAPVAAAPAPAPAPAPADASEAAMRQAKLDYATMEDGYLNDPKGQWAGAAKSSSNFNDDADRQAYAVGSPDGRNWAQKSLDVGFDWIELSYPRPVHANEIRAVLAGRSAIEAITKVELVDTEGQSHVVWNGLSDGHADERGSRSWFVRKFERTAYSAASVKLTFANNVSSGTKDVDAVQLVGD